MEISYSALMGENTPHIVLRLQTKQPIELTDFVHAFTALANEYERFVRAQHPELTDQATVYVKQVREGSIEAELWAIMHFATQVDKMQPAQPKGRFSISAVCEGARLSA